MMKRGVTVMIIRCYYGVMEQNGDAFGRVVNGEEQW